MEVKNGNNVTASGDSDPQMPAAVSGSGVKAGSNVAGSLRSLSNDREGAGVASQAPAALSNTSAVTPVLQGTSGGNRRTKPHDPRPDVTETLSNLTDHQAALRSLGKNLQIHDGGLKLLQTKTTELVSACGKLSSEPAKAFIQELQMIVKGLRENREEITKAFNAAVKSCNNVANTMKQKPAEDKKPEMVDEGTQSPCWWDQNDGTLQKPSSAKGTNPVAEWTEVVKKAPKAKKTARLAPRSSDGEPPKVVENPKRVRMRPPTILVDVGSEKDFPGLVKKIKSGANKEIIEDRVMGMRKTRSGRLLIEVKGDADQVEAVRAEVSRSAGDEIGVRILQQKTLLEIRDLDQWTASEEVVNSVAAATGAPSDAVKVISLRKRYGGTQSALVLAPSPLCRNLVARGRIRVGLVNCRVRQGDPRVRCFRCLSFGHVSKECAGPDRSTCCRRCGSPGHRAASCEASKQVVKAFEAILAEPLMATRQAVTGDAKAAAETSS